MGSRRDQLDAYRFVGRRISSALLAGEPETTELPLRRIGMTAFISVMVAAVVLAGFGVVGFLLPGRTSSWQTGDSLIVEKETGARYVYLPDQETLYPVVNFASARLLLRRADVKVVTVARRSLTGVTRGRPVGILGAPDSLPDPKSPIGLPWTLCSTETDDVSGSSVRAVLLVGQDLGSGIAPGQGLVVTAGDEEKASETYLVYDGHRLRIDDVRVLRALGLDDVRRLPVSHAWLDTLAPGPDLRIPTVPGAGKAGLRIGGRTTTVGQQLTVESSGETRRFLVLEQGVAEISATTSQLLMARGGASPVEARLSDVVAAPEAEPLEVEGYPADLPEAVSLPPGDRRGACVRWTDGSGRADAPTVAVLGRDDDTLLEAGLASSTSTSIGTVLVPSGRGTLVRQLPAAAVSSGSLFLITDVGVKYPIPSADAASWLGYDPSAAIPVPTAMLDLLPDGPALDPERAGETASEATVSSSAGQAGAPSS